MRYNDSMLTGPSELWKVNNTKKPASHCKKKETEIKPDIIYIQ